MLTTADFLVGQVLTHVSNKFILLYLNHEHESSIKYFVLEYSRFYLFIEKFYSRVELLKIFSVYNNIQKLALQSSSKFLLNIRFVLMIQQQNTLTNRTNINKVKSWLQPIRIKKIFLHKRKASVPPIISPKYSIKYISLFLFYTKIKIVSII